MNSQKTCIACSIIAGCIITLTALASLNRNTPQRIMDQKSQWPNQQLEMDNATIPQPWHLDELDWWTLHKTRVEKSKEGKSLFFFGDSITEAWEGTSLGHVPRAHRLWNDGEDESMRTIFQTYFGTEALSFGVGGDQTQNLLWRLEHGELPTTNTTHPSISQTAVLMIGTNNIGAGMLPQSTLLGIAAISRYILQHGNMDLLLCDIFPRFDNNRLPKLCPPRCNKNGSPLQSFLPAINKVNAGLPALLKDLRMEFPSRKIAISSCGFIFSGDDTQIMPDHLHPNSKGQELWAKCLVDHLAILKDLSV